MDCAFFLILAATPFKVLALGGGPVALGLVPAIGSIIYIGFTLLAGRWSDRAGRTLLCLGGNLMLILFTLTAYRCQSLFLLLALVPLMGIGKALYWPAVEASVGDLSGTARLTLNIGRFNVAWSSGKASGFALSGLLLSHFGFRTTFLVGAGLVVLAFLWLPKGTLQPGPTATGKSAPADEQGGRGNRPAPAITDRERRLFRNMGWLANLAANGAAAVLVSQLPAWFVTGGWGETRFGIFLALVFVVQTLSFMLLARKVRFTYSERRLWIPQAVAILPLLAIPWYPAWGWLLAIAPVLGIAFGVSYSSSIYYSLHTERSKGMYAGIHEALVGAGGFLPPLLAGLLARWTAWLGAPYLLAAGVVLGALVCQVGMWMRWRQATSGLPVGLLLLAVLIVTPGTSHAERFWPPWLRDDRPAVYPDIAVTAGWLATHLADPDLMVVDARPLAAYLAGHLPGAVPLPVDSLPVTTRAAELLGRSGLRSEDLIVCHGDRTTFLAAAYLFWRLELAGGRRIRFLDGGIDAWRQAGGTLVTEPTPRVAVSWTSEPDTSRLADVPYLVKHYGQPGFEILDARASGFGTTQLAMEAPGSVWREGHIPHALPVDFLTMIQPNGNLIPPEQMRDQLGTVGPRPGNPLDLEAEITVYDDGISSSGARGYLFLRMAGITGVRYYPGGWQQWVTDPRRPVVRILPAQELADRLSATTPDTDTALPFVLLDVRHQGDFQRGHIPGAVLLPSHQFPDSLETILNRFWPGVDRRTTPAVVYCYGPHCIRSRNCATTLARAGFSRPEWFRGGIQHWKKLQSNSQPDD